MAKSEKHCPLCNIPNKEPLLFENNLVYLVPTKDLKGHKIRVMAVTKRHTTKPTFEEQITVDSILINFMENMMGGQGWFIADNKYATIPDHWHRVAADMPTKDEIELDPLFIKTPKVCFPLQKNKVLIGIPAYNAEETLHSVINKAFNYGDVLIVNDGSTDHTSEVIPPGKAILLSHKTNQGYGATIRDIFQYAKKQYYDILITLDSDGQHDPSEIPKFLKAIKTSDVVIGNRFIKKDRTPNYRKVGIKTISMLNKTEDSQCGFRAYNRKAILTITDKIHEKGMGASVEILKLLQKRKLKLTEVSCTINYGKEKHSQNPISHGINLVTAFFVTSLWMNPTKLLGPFGLLSIITALVAGIQTINIYAQFKIIVLSWALLTVSSIICTLLIFNALSIILILKNKRMYEK